MIEVGMVACRGKEMRQGNGKEERGSVELWSC